VRDNNPFELGISHERVRQIELRAFENVQSGVRTAIAQTRLAFTIH
jgi:DNA-directed RNA polymerase sigma subunit (sigma70/sigma32)